ncbi:hypothetical protein [Paenibacillus kobensis]|uniref:hypothetical protein n=1 Tax=Paenibacillus kobensis TaxID=59841 RepID=UPI000FD9676E|nr:hypothetical protein [Paenibacillus kobensis]
MNRPIMILIGTNVLNGGGHNDTNLEDSERKIHRILFNLFRLEQGQVNIETLSRLSQRSTEVVRRTLDSLDQLGMIKWYAITNRVLVLDTGEQSKKLHRELLIGLDKRTGRLNRATLLFITG